MWQFNNVKNLINENKNEKWWAYRMSLRYKIIICMYVILIVQWYLVIFLNNNVMYQFLTMHS